VGRRRRSDDDERDQRGGGEREAAHARGLHGPAGKGTAQDVC
jgi:hypothetical protein